MIRRTILTVALVLAGTDALAQRRPRPQGTGLTGEADERFRRGIQLATENNYQAALVEFRRAYEVSRNALILFNVGAMEVELSHFAEGLDALQEYERAAPAPVVQARRAQIDALLERIRTRSGTITVALNIEALRVQIDAVGTSGVRVVREGAAARAAIRVPIGRYRITITAPGFRPREVEQDIASNSDTRVDQALEPAMATLAIRSNVEAAEVKVDGRTIGTTPLPPQQVTEGAHRIEVTRPGYSPFAVNVNAQGENGVIDAALEWAPSIAPTEAGRMALDRDYRDVECSIDGQRVACDGTDNVPPGPHMLRVAGRDYLPAEQRVRLDAGRVTRVEITLTARPEAIREQQERQSAHRRTGFIIGGVGLAVAIGGGIWLPLSLIQRADDADTQSLFESYKMRCSMSLPAERFMCINDLLPMGIRVTTPMALDELGASIDADVASSTTMVALAGVTLGVGVVGIVVGGIIVGTAPPDRFANPPPRRARLAPQFVPSLNGFGLRF
ncbi:MAG: PEGA domain-containing protein [Myxococcales bacterium]|nr:PEGA domain-containing protein [Myxococcales bacterium]